MSDRFYFFKGRVALYAILKAIGIGPGDEVILPGFTCVVVPNAIVYLGAKPVYADIDPVTYNIDPNKIENKITGKARVIIAQHTFGIPCDMDRITETGRIYNLYIIEDSCHAIGSKYKGREVGAFGDAAFFSSQWSKPITTGIGGWAIINNEQISAHMQRIYPEFISPSYMEDVMLRLQYAAYSTIFKPSLFWPMRDMYRRLSKAGLAIGSSSNEELECRMPAHFGKRMSEWQKEVLGKKIEGLAKSISHRKWVVSLYESYFKETGIKAVGLPPGDYDPVFLRYPVSVKNKKKILEEAKRRRIELGDWFLSPIHPNLERWEKVDYKAGMCPNAEKICRYIVNLPTHEGINEEEARKIVSLICNS